MEHFLEGSAPLELTKKRRFYLLFFSFGLPNLTEQLCHQRSKWLGPKIDNGECVKSLNKKNILFNFMKKLENKIDFAFRMWFHEKNNQKTFFTSFYSEFVFKCITMYSTVLNKRACTQCQNRHWKSPCWVSWCLQI